MEKEVLVYVDLQGTPHLVGRLWGRMRKGSNSATFEYDKSWLTQPEHFSLEPALTLGPGPFHTPSDKPLFGAIGDSAPDRWGRVPDAPRRASARGERRNDAPHLERDRLPAHGRRRSATRGASSCRTRGRAIPVRARSATKIPPLIELTRLLSATERVLADAETDEDLRLLLAPGSSLGGARPKASVRYRDGSLAIAKFPNKGDEINAVLWEAVA